MTPIHHAKKLSEAGSGGESDILCVIRDLATRRRQEAQVEEERRQQVEAAERQQRHDLKALRKQAKQRKKEEKKQLKERRRIAYVEYLILNETKAYSPSKRRYSSSRAAANEPIRRPRINTARLLAGDNEMSLSGHKCLQCTAKRMPCSQEALLRTETDPRWPHAPCRRCVRNGDECLTWWPRGGGGGGGGENDGDGDADELGIWVFAEPPARFRGYRDDAAVRRRMVAEEQALAAALCDVRDGVRAEVVGHRMELVGILAPAKADLGYRDQMRRRSGPGGGGGGGDDAGVEDGGGGDGHVKQSLA